MKKILLLSLNIITLLSLAEGNSRYSYSDCTYVKGDYVSRYYGSRCFCYTAGGIKWKDIWSTFQVSVTSVEDILVVYPMETRNCRDPYKDLVTLATCMIEPYWPSSVQKESTLDIPLAAEEVFFMTKSPRASAEYTLQVSNQRFNWMRFFLFVSGLTLFFFAGEVCRSSLFFYISGVSLGMISIVVFLLLVLKSFVPKRGLLFLVLFGAGSGLSYLGLQKLLNEGDEILRLYWRGVLCYLVLSGFISFIFCYKLGPITNKHTLNLMTWAMQAVAMVVTCYGITYTPLSVMLLVLLLSVRILPLVFAILLGIWRQICWLLGVFQGRRHPKTRLLTEEEYREQGERHTKASLEELRKYCNNPGFPAWETVLKLRSPQRFAEFLRNGSHVTASEQLNHEQRHDPGAEYTEKPLLDTTRSSGTSEDLCDDELQAYSHRPPSTSSFSPPSTSSFSPPSISCFSSPSTSSLSPPSTSSFHPPPALPSPPAYTAPICPYPPTFYPPLPQPALAEEDDDPF